MTRPVLETKLHMPAWRKGLITRPRLLERLNRVAGSKLMLVSAPAGFGKTTLLAAFEPVQLPGVWVGTSAARRGAAMVHTHVARINP